MSHSNTNYVPSRVSRAKVHAQAPLPTKAEAYHANAGHEERKKAVKAHARGKKRAVKHELEKIGVSYRER